MHTILLKRKKRGRKDHSRWPVSLSLRCSSYSPVEKLHKSSFSPLSHFFHLFILLLTNILSRFNLVLRHLLTFNRTQCRFVADAAVDESVRIVLDFLRRIKLEPDCTASSRHAWRSAVSGLDSLLHIHFLLSLHNFSYVNNLV